MTNDPEIPVYGRVFRARTPIPDPLTGGRTIAFTFRCDAAGNLKDSIRTSPPYTQCISGEYDVEDCGVEVIGVSSAGETSIKVPARRESAR